MCGWDSDNPTATWGGLLGLMYGHKAMQEHFTKHDFSNSYHIERTRFNMPVPLDNFDDMAERGAQIIDDIVVNIMDGSVQGDRWIIPIQRTQITAQDVPKTNVPWITIEDSDSSWDYKGFTSNSENWNASGASLTKGYANCAATLTFT
mgnify:CR=1 FL=1